MRIVSAIAFVLFASACSTPMMSMHGSETEKNHYVILEDGGADVFWDCYSRENGAWQPTCREVRKERYTDGAWADAKTVRTRN